MESQHLFSVVKNMDKSIEAFMKKFYDEKNEISKWLDSIVVQTFTKKVQWTMEKAYKEAHKFVNLDMELKVAKKECTTIPTAMMGKEKR